MPSRRVLCLPQGPSADVKQKPAVPKPVTDVPTANSRVRMNAGSSIDYDALTQSALRGVVRMVLTQAVARGGLPGEHHFYIAFNTQAPGVVLSRRLKEKYPDEMMIVLQHRFWDLAVTEDGFEVKLTFDGIPERLCIPFDSIRVFFDPSVRFTLQFGEALGSDEGEGAPGRRRSDNGRNADRRGRHRTQKARNEGSPDSASPVPQINPAPTPAATPSAPTVLAPRPVPAAAPTADGEAPPKGAGAKVFSLDQFRKK